VTEWEPDYPSGKPNEADSEDSSEQVIGGFFEIN